MGVNNEQAAVSHVDGAFDFSAEVSVAWSIDEIDGAATTTPPKPIISDSIQVTYTGKILSADTAHFTSVTDPVDIALKDQIAGWKIMLPQYVSKGTKITMYIPSGFGYGSSATTAIPANSNLIYQVKLINVIH